jgi:nitrous oxide reductase accessory protein NosL
MASARSRTLAGAPGLGLRIALAALLLAGYTVLSHRSAPANPPAVVVELDADHCIAAPAPVAAQPHDPATGQAIHAARPLPDSARCPVCRMAPARSPRWAAQLIHADGATHFFDSPVDLLRFLGDRARYDPARQSEAVAARYVTDFDGGGWVAFEAATFVIGSDTPGPMRTEGLPAFASRAAAARFAQASGGRLADATAVARWQATLAHGGAPHRH